MHDHHVFPWELPFSDGGALALHRQFLSIASPHLGPSFVLCPQEESHGLLDRRSSLREVVP